MSAVKKNGFVYYNPFLTFINKNSNLNLFEIKEEKLLAEKSRAVSTCISLSFFSFLIVTLKYYVLTHTLSEIFVFYVSVLSGTFLVIASLLEIFSYLNKFSRIPARQILISGGFVPARDVKFLFFPFSFFLLFMFLYFTLVFSNIKYISTLSYVASAICIAIFIFGILDHFRDFRE